MAHFDNLKDLYSPSKYASKNLEQHIQFIGQGNEEARTRIKCHLDIPYGPRDRQKIDIFGTDLPEDSPIFVFIHGGYWQVQSIGRDTYHFVANTLYKKGAKSIFVGYNLCPEVLLTEIVQEIVVALKKCLKYYRDNRSRGLYLIGYSAGAHLAAMLFTDFVQDLLSIEDQKCIKAVFLMAGIYDLIEIPRTWVNDLLKLDQTKATELSPYSRKISATENTAFLVFAAENDSPEFVKQSRLFHEKLQRLNVATQFHTIPNTDHFEIVESLVDDDFLVSRLISNIIEQ